MADFLDGEVTGREKGKREKKNGVTYLKARLEIVPSLSLQNVVTGSSGFIFTFNSLSHRRPR